MEPGEQRGKEIRTTRKGPILPVRNRAANVTGVNPNSVIY